MTAGPGQPARRNPVPGHRKHVARTIILAWFARWPFDRRFWHAMAMLAIAVGAARASARDSQARVAAWDTRQRERHMKATTGEARAARRA
jgi:hypothetical protein